MSSPQQFSHLSLFAPRVMVGRPLPFNIFDHDRTLLLARGQVVQTEALRLALFDRGALVDLEEVQFPRDRIQHARREELPAIWAEQMNQLGNTLRQCDQPGFKGALEASTPAVMALVARDPDLAIFQVLRQEGNAHVQYGIDHSLHTAITTQLVATRLGWTAEEARLAFNVALTMNLGMLELQGQLAEQTTPPTEDQRATIQAHPALSRMILETAGVSDERWLEAVAQHHETPEGTGYPYGITTASPVADLVRRADIYTAKLSSRQGRSAIAADQAGRQMFMAAPGDPMVAALVKEFGVYPPGCWVRLASGETGIVVRRGPTVFTPEVVVLTTRSGAALPAPARRDTGQKAFAVQTVLGARDPRPQLSTAQMMVLAGA